MAPAGIWDAHPTNGPIIALAAKCLRVSLGAASPLHMSPDARTPTVYLAQMEHWAR